MSAGNIGSFSKSSILMKSLNKVPGFYLMYKGIQALQITQ